MGIAEYSEGKVIGSQDLVENKPVLFGAGLTHLRYSSDSQASRNGYANFWDTFVAPMDDVTFDITIQYQIHEL